MESLLPAEIKLDIFSRLPADSVLQCRQVCRTWRTLLHLPHFAQMHLCRSLQLDKVGILYFGKNHDHGQNLYYGEHDEYDEQSYKTLKMLYHPCPKYVEGIVGSCNGLICYSENDVTGIHISIVICNPITKEYVYLPVFNTDISKTKERYITRRIVYGFGYLPPTNEYKVVIIIYHGNQLNPLQWIGTTQVYTLGGCSGWRNKEETSYVSSGSGVLANGALNWLNHDDTKIVVFDLADEEFRLLLLPPNIVSDAASIYELKVLGGLLFLLHLTRGGGAYIWSLEKNSSTNVMIEQEYQSWSLQKEFSIAPDIPVSHIYYVLAFTKSGEVLLLHYPEISFPDYTGEIHSILSSYDPKTATLRNLDVDMLLFQVMPHLNSFISLKALGEEGFKEIRKANLEVEQFCSTL